MKLEKGAQLNQYSITEKIGEGGMGSVYSAEDIRLGRRVALKILPAELASDPVRLERFEREARTIAALNHPNVVTLYSVETSGGTHFLTMELVEGSSLASLLPKHGFALDRFFELAIPTVEAVAAAHARGIAHRDLKPTNVMVDKQGRVKVLDFGLAKELARPIAGALESQLPTFAVTGAGMILGTVAYMSPEQAQGLDVDERSDVFSLGILLYEMLTGARPFTGGTPVSVISAILRANPEPVRHYRGGIPKQMQRILDTCLAKDPSRRYQSVLDLRNALESLRDEIPTGGEQDVAPPRAGAGVAAALWLIVGAAVGGSVGYLAAHRGDSAGMDFTSSGGRRVLPLVASVMVLPESPDVSPDGAWVVYSAEVGGRQGIWKVAADSGESRQLTEGLDREMSPVFSPDGSKIAFHVAAGQRPGIYVMSEDGGAADQLVAYGVTPAWSRGGDRLAFEWQGGVWTTSTDIGATQTNVAANVGVNSHPAWGAGDGYLLAYSETANDLVRISLGDGSVEPLRIVPTGNQVADLAISRDGGDLLLAMGQYGGNKSLWHVPLDPASGRPVGIASRLTDGITDDRDVAISPDGRRIVFLARDVTRDLYALPLDDVNGPGVRLTATARQNHYPSVSADGTRLVWTAQVMGAGLLFSRPMQFDPYARSTTGEPDGRRLTQQRDPGIRETGGSFAPDGERLVYSSTRGNQYRLWHTREGGVPRLFAQGTGGENADFGDYMPAWSGDGERIAFYSNRSGSEDIWVLNADGGEPRRVTTLPGIEQIPVWTRDSRRIVFRSMQDSDADLWIVDSDGSNLGVLVDTPADEAWAAWSPNGDRLYFASDLSGRYEIWSCATDGSWACREVSDLRQETNNQTELGGLPDHFFFTKFAIAGNQLIVPLEFRSGELWSLELPPRSR